MLAATNLPEFSVSELSFALKRTVEDAYGQVRVKGELSGFKRAASGHLYFSLKDERACLDAVAWRSTLPKLSFEPADGLEVVCTGRLTTYPGRSKYQLSVERIEPAGAGALMALLEERRRRLEAEGLFGADRKRPLPVLPGLIGIVTSPTGAVIRDILHRLAERFPRRVIVWPVVVQGEGAAEQIAGAIAGFERLSAAGALPRPDLLIVARGGGSIEDLWAFNEEVVVRAVAACTIPLISAVGHETDTTLIDHVADRRAPTPSAAAEMAVPVRAELVERLEQLEHRKRSAVVRSLRELVGRLDGLRRGLPEPSALLRMAGQRLDDLTERLRLRSPAEIVRGRKDILALRAARLHELIRDRLARADERAAGMARRLEPSHLAAVALRGRERLDRLAPRADLATARLLERRAETLVRTAALLDSLGPRKVLERGYAIVRKDGRVLPTAAAAAAAASFVLTFADGDLAAHAGTAPAPSRRPRPGPSQGTLL